MYNLESTLNNEGNNLWSETRAKATDMGLSSLSGSVSYAQSGGPQGILWRQGDSPIRYIFRAQHLTCWSALEDACAHGPVKTLRILIAKKCGLM